jgi:Na+-transporting methylmalonyl-CoA/oxaloacetate decarboxylase gamma subunit
MKRVLLILGALLVFATMGIVWIFFVCMVAVIVLAKYTGNEETPDNLGIPPNDKSSHTHFHLHWPEVSFLAATIAIAEKIGLVDWLDVHTLLCSLKHMLTFSL